MEHQLWSAQHITLGLSLSWFTCSLSWSQVTFRDHSRRTWTSLSCTTSRRKPSRLTPSRLFWKLSITPRASCESSQSSGPQMKRAETQSDSSWSLPMKNYQNFCARRSIFRKNLYICTSSCTENTSIGSLWMCYYFSGATSTSQIAASQVWCGHSGIQLITI